MAHLNYSQRIQIAELIQQGKSNAQIATALGVHRSTIGREIQRNAESREKYAALFAHIESKNRQREAGPFRNKFGSRSKLFNVQEKRNAFYSYLSKSHAAFFIPFNYLRLHTLPNSLLYSGPIDTHIYSVSRLPVYRLSNVINVGATGIILPYEKKSGDKYIFRPGQSQGLSNPIKGTDRIEISSARDLLSPRIKHGGKKDRLREEFSSTRDLHGVSPRVKHEGKKDCVMDDLLRVPPRVKHGVKKDFMVDDKADKRAALLYLLLMYDIRFTHPYFLIRIVPSPTWPSFSYILLVFFQAKIFQIPSPKKI